MVLVPQAPTTNDVHETGVQPFKYFEYNLGSDHCTANLNPPDPKTITGSPSCDGRKSLSSHEHRGELNLQ